MSDLNNFQKQMLSSVDAYISKFGHLHYSLPRRHGKSRSAQITTANATLRGVSAENSIQILLDDLGWSPPVPRKPALGPEHVFDNPQWPGSRIEVWRLDKTKRDPRHPNPAAGTITQYEIRDENGKLETVSGLNLAVARAEHLHELAIAEAQEKMRQLNPNFGRF
ncbi:MULTISPECIES: hypothetical protein [unclassified Ensifer]|uniref:hypothetical protein n=1 Tax=unclassified Ensifer TaxID=2633371 RepID=UPI0008130853|nr:MULTISPECIES: hypothetical protein [unclassified Ensifer]OCP21964.1 hypothetical protein BC361_25690 [Ensifer sp. LC54]OCP23256.1 hypothetical protein BC363_25075 [Ensifer sp. LC384]